MEVTFISIHDLSPDARTLYASDSIVDILGYSPEEVVDRPCWEFFHPDEIPIAQAKHGKGVELDKAAVLSYCRMRDKDGRWLGCEVTFTVVYDVLVACTSIYRRGLKSQNRALEAPAIRRLFSSSPQDPRYHMLSHISTKFTSPLKPGLHEPRSALFLNRYTRTLTIMYATNGLADVLGLSGEEMIGKSFYYCIQETCLQDAVNCLENAKANDSIAYLRFWYRDPLQDEQTPTTSRAAAASGGLNLQRGDSEAIDSRSQEREPSNTSGESQPVSATASVEPVDTPMSNSHLGPPHLDSRTSSGDSNAYTHEAVFGEPVNRESSDSSMSNSVSDSERTSTSPPAGIELEAVVSCTSDGMVVCLRRAASPIPAHPAVPAEPDYNKGLFATPWSKEPILPPSQLRTQDVHQAGFAPGFAPGASFERPLVQQQNPAAQADFMNSIREIAVFAWAIVGINGSLADYGKGQPRGESQPASGLQIWQPNQNHDRSVNEQDRGQLLPQQNGDPSRSHAAEINGNIFHSEALAYSNNRTSQRNGSRTSGFGFGDPGLDRR